jgi:regulator of ribonuclease activity B
VIPKIDQERWEAVWAADLDVLRSLGENGDQSDLPRLVDVSFRGSPDALDRLASSASNFGFSVQSRDSSDDEEPWLFLERVQTADIDAIRDLTMTYLQIEDAFEVECDGWGCLAQTGPKQ